jgi:hypothetical protein
MEQRIALFFRVVILSERSESKDLQCFCDQVQMFCRKAAKKDEGFSPWRKNERASG